MTLPDHYSYYLQEMELYETKTNYYLIGSDETRTFWRVLKIDRSESSQLVLNEDPTTYTWREINDILWRLSLGNKNHGGLKLVTKAYGIVGFIKFLEPFYIILVTKREKVGTICGHSVYKICESKLFQIPCRLDLCNGMYQKTEDRYKELFCSINLCEDFFYSHTYRIMRCLQKNATESDLESIPFDDMFVWNEFLTREFQNQIHSSQWTVPLVHGFFKQARLHCWEFTLILTLIARRSKHFAGTRYFKRGVSRQGNVANDVETEQLVYVENTDQISSVVQHRGSIPLFWSQETSLWIPKPDIILQKSCDPTFEATKLHFENLVARYQDPIVILDLAKTKEKQVRETSISKEYLKAVDFINQSLPESKRMRFIKWDMHKHFMRKKSDFDDSLETIASEVIEDVGFYYSKKASQNAKLNQGTNDEERSIKTKFQHGVLRSNCIDCLDRTNYLQQTFGLVALGRQLLQLEVSDTGCFNRDSSVFKSLMSMYDQMGDAIAFQYAGSPASKKFSLHSQGMPAVITQSQELLRAVWRHCSNAILDGVRQDAIHVFLGHHVPATNKIFLWEMDPTNQLECRRAAYDATNLRRSIKRSLSAGDLTKQIKDGLEDNQDAVKELSEAKPRSRIMRRKASSLSHSELQALLQSDRLVSEAIDQSISVDMAPSRSSIGITKSISEDFAPPRATIGMTDSECGMTISRSAVVH